MARFSSARGDDGADVLAGERAAEIARDEAIHDLHLADVTCRGEQIEHREFEDRVVQPLRLHLGDRDLRDEGGTLRGLRVGGVEAVFVFHEDHRLAAELLGNEEASGVGAVGRNHALGCWTHPQAVRRHAAEDDGVHLGKVERHGREPGAADRGDTVLRKELPQHRCILIGNRGAELREDAGRQAKPGRDRVEMSRPGAGSGSDQELVGLAGRGNLIDQRIDRGTPSIDDALSADLDHGGIRQDPEVRRRIRRSHKLRIGERTLHEERLELCGRVFHRGIPFRFSKR
jgi:hypothetical protein